MRRVRTFVFTVLVGCAGTRSESPPEAAVNDAKSADGSAEPAEAEPAEAEPAEAEQEMVSERWSPVVDELELRVEPPPGPVSAGAALTLALHFRNTGAQPRRIYLINAEPFRAMQSTFYLDRGAERPPVIQPEPRPHGYVVTEADFHSIDPGQTLRFEQTLRIPADLAAGTYSVRWTYRNKVERWKGGVQTLDGPTKALFGGERIEGIWVGEQDYRFEVVVQPA